MHRLRAHLFVICALCCASFCSAALAQDEVRPDDAVIEQQLQAIFQEIESLDGVEVDVAAGVVTLSGEAQSAAEINRAVGIAEETAGVITVENEIERSLSVEDSLTPAADQLRSITKRTIEGLPLYGLALLVSLVIAWLGGFLSRRASIWNRLVPNAFLAELVAQAFRVASIILALVIAFNIIGATAFLGAVLGGAGVAGIALGFAVRDTLENYISSVMLSLRQPFRANDHVVIDGDEGKVIRLTARATILMTLDGNHLRLPNSTVFKAKILNYTRNSERRFEFQLGVDANDDPMEAISTGVAAITALDFVLAEPPSWGKIETVGDSNIVLTFYGWVDQRDADFAKARSAAIRAAKDAVEAAGFSLPEPIYRLRIDEMPGQLTISEAGPQTEGAEPPKTKPAAKPQKPAAQTDAADVAPDDAIDEKVAEERADAEEPDLLDSTKPVE